MESQKKTLDSCHQITHGNITRETADTQYEVERARLDKKRELFAQVHDTYSAQIYGSPARRDQMNKQYLASLLTQVKEKEKGKRSKLVAKSTECQVAFENDKKCVETDRAEDLRKSNYMKQFRDENKRLMETKAEEAKLRKVEENRRDRELYRINPINWSNTLR